MNATTHVHDFHAIRARAIAPPVDVMSSWRLVVWASTAVVLFLLALACPRRSRAPEPLAAIAFVPALLDAIFGGNRRERLLYPYRFTRGAA